MTATIATGISDLRPNGAHGWEWTWVHTYSHPVTREPVSTRTTYRTATNGRGLYCEHENGNRCLVSRSFSLRGLELSQVGDELSRWGDI
jgi:hypothetical protein